MIEYVSVGLGLAALLGQALNYMLYLRIRVAILESEQRTLDKVAHEYVRHDTCEVRHETHHAIQRRAEEA